MARKLLKNNRLVSAPGQDAEEYCEAVDQYECYVQRQEYPSRRDAADSKAAAAIALRIFLILRNRDKACYQRRRRKQEAERAAPADRQASDAQTEETTASV